jgi:hypothetical protein
VVAHGVFVLGHGVERHAKIMSCGGWKSFVSPWGTFKCGMGNYDLWTQKSKICVLVIFGHMWVAVVACGVFV